MDWPHSVECYYWKFHAWLCDGLQSKGPTEGDMETSCGGRAGLELGVNCAIGEGRRTAGAYGVLWWRPYARTRTMSIFDSQQVQNCHLSVQKPKALIFAVCRLP